jgi:DNA-binding transcriptional LysR family regulator
VELGTTQPAISQQIKRLEEQLGRAVRPIYRGIELTEGGAMLFEQVQLGLQNIDAGLSAISTQQQHEVLQVATDFAFAAYWLMPRLHRFHEANPKVDVSLVTSERNHNMLRTDIDVAVLFGDGRFKQGESHWLFSEEVFPVCSPQLLKERALPPAQALLEFPLLHLRGKTAATGLTGAGCFANWASAPRQRRAIAFRQLHPADSGGDWRPSGPSAGATLWITC